MILNVLLILYKSTKNDSDSHLQKLLLNAGAFLS